MLITEKFTRLVNKLTFLKTNAHLRFVLLPWLSFNNGKCVDTHKSSWSNVLKLILCISEDP